MTYKKGQIIMYRHLISFLLIVGFMFIFSTLDTNAQNSRVGVWISPAEIAVLPMFGPAWEKLKDRADAPLRSQPNLSAQNGEGIQVFAKALVYARTMDERYRQEVIRAVKDVIGTEGDDALATFRALGTYVIAADLVKLPTSDDQLFRNWLTQLLNPSNLVGSRSLVGCHEDRANNWGTHAGASRAAIAVYLNDTAEIERTAQVFKGWLGDRSSYAGFDYGDDLTWQADPNNPVGINPVGAAKNGQSIDGVLPDDQRRCGSFQWPPCKTNYVWEGLQGVLAQAVILNRAGYDVWNWQNKAILRAVKWLHNEASFPAEGDDTWQPHIINYYYGTNFPGPLPSRPGKNVGFTDWTHKSLNFDSNDPPSAPRNLRIVIDF